MRIAVGRESLRPWYDKLREVHHSHLYVTISKANIKNRTKFQGDYSYFGIGLKDYEVKCSIPSKFALSKVIYLSADLHIHYSSVVPPCNYSGYGKAVTLGVSENES